MGSAVFKIRTWTNDAFKEFIFFLTEAMQIYTTLFGSSLPISCNFYKHSIPLGLFQAFSRSRYGNLKAIAVLRTKGIVNGLNGIVIVMYL